MIFKGNHAGQFLEVFTKNYLVKFLEVCTIKYRLLFCSMQLINPLDHPGQCLRL